MRNGSPDSLLLLFWLLAACAGSPPQGLGVKEGRLAPCPTSPNCVSSQAQADGHRIAPFSFLGDVDEDWKRLGAIVSGRPDARVVAAQEGYLRVEFRTALGFVDDAEFLLDRAARRAHVRSASRVGYSDLRKNRSRLEEIRRAFNGK